MGEMKERGTAVDKWGTHYDVISGYWGESVFVEVSGSVFC
jgi:hypothetical protein